MLVQESPQWVSIGVFLTTSLMITCKVLIDAPVSENTGKSYLIQAVELGEVFF